MTKLYLITPPKIDIDPFAKLFAQLANNDIIACLQLRLKDASDEEIIHAAKTLLPICRAHKIDLIMNDRPDLAQISDCDGVHIGQSDTPYAEARAVLGKDKIIGVTCHASRHLAMEAAEAGADYVAFGAFYPSPTKPDAPPAPLELLEIWSETTIIPCVAIGGITPDNAAPLIKAGADFLAVSSAVWANPADTIAAFTTLFNSANRLQT